MKSPALFFLLVLLPPATACGPWFPDTVLDQPQAALDVPPVCYEDELAELFPDRVIPESEPAGQQIHLPEENPQVAAECRELAGVWRAAGLDAAGIDERTNRYRELRIRQRARVESMGYSVGDLVIHPEPEPGARPLAEILPEDVADYIEGVRLLGENNIAGAREVWTQLLARPADSRRLRSVWAAWMLAKTSPDHEAGAWYERARREAAAGNQDILGLGLASAAWLAPRHEDPIEGLRMMAGAWKGGRTEILNDLRRAARRMLDGQVHGDDVLAACAADPVVRQLLTIEAFALMDGPRMDSWSGSPPDQQAEFPFARWLAALEAAGPEKLERADRMAWALYADGRYDAAKRWLAMADPSHPRALWLQAKLDLRDGKLPRADRALARALAKSSRLPGWSPGNPVRDGLAYDDAQSASSATQGRMLSDAAIINMAQGEFIRALGQLTEANFWTDAAYVAESVLTTDELLSHVRRAAPRWSPGLMDWWQGKVPGAPPPETGRDGRALSDVNVMEFSTRTDDLRYLLGRRLTREYRFREAREFLPAPVLPAFDDFVALQRAARSGEHRGADLAAILWAGAVHWRHNGMALAGTEGAPDGSEHGGMFEATDFLAMRRQRDGWKTGYESDDERENPPALARSLPDHRRAIPGIAAAEIRRADDHAVRPRKRWHYRYTAADQAWKAAAALPDNTAHKAYMLNTAGIWLAARDPEAADKFYKELVRRNRQHPLGQAADHRRWFLSLDAPPALPMPPIAR